FAAWVANQQLVQHPPVSSDQYSDPLAYAGYQLFVGSGGCAPCHTVEGTPAQGEVGPNLTHLQARGYFAGDILQVNNDDLRMWLRDPQAVKPGANMRIR